MINTFTGIFAIAAFLLILMSIAWLGLMLWDEVKYRIRDRRAVKEVKEHIRRMYEEDREEAKCPDQK